MYMGETESGFGIEVKPKERLNTNNLITCFGDSGNGKTTLLKNLAASAKAEGIPVIIPDTSESYPLAKIKALGDKEYFDIACDGLPIDMFRPRTVYYDGNEVFEDNIKIANRITGNLLQAFNLEGGTQIATLTTAVKKHLCSLYPKKSFDGINIYDNIYIVNSNQTVNRRSRRNDQSCEIWRQLSCECGTVREGRKNYTSGQREKICGTQCPGKKKFKGHKGHRYAVCVL